MSVTSHIIRKTLTLTLASVSLMALGVTAVFAGDPDQALEDLLGIAPETQTRTPDRSLTITRPDVPRPVQPTVSRSAGSAPVPPVAPPAAPPVTPLAAAPKADGGKIPGKHLATLPATPAALPEKSAPAQDAGTPTAPNDPRLPSAVLQARAGLPSTAPQNIALSSPIGVPRPLPELVPPTADAPTGAKGAYPAQATLRMIPQQQPAPLAVDDLVDRLIFPAFSSSLPQELRESISRKILTELRQRPSLRVQISGFADWTPNGSVEASAAISQRRAENVARFLREQGIAERRLQIRGVGVDFLPGAPRDRVDVTVIAP